jgi:hypothetical protein
VKNKPEPVAKNVVCSLCDEPWSDHKPDSKGNVSTLECIRLLKRRPKWNWHGPTTWPYQWTSTGTGIDTTCGTAVTYNTPSVA